MCERRVWRSSSPFHLTQDQRREEVMMKFMLRMLAAMALATLTADVSLGAVISVVRSNKTQGNKLGHEHGQTPKSGQGRVTPKNNVIRSVTSPNGQKSAASVLAAATGNRSIADLRSSTSVTAAAGLPPARFKPASPATPMPLQGAPAISTRAAAPATHIPATVSGPPAFRVTPSPATAAYGGTVSGTIIKPHTSTLAALGGAVTGKGTALLSGTGMRPKTH